MVGLMPKEKEYIVPGLEIRISESWVRFVRFCQTRVPNGDIKIKVVNAQPTKLLEVKPDVRFDKEETIPIDF